MVKCLLRTRFRLHTPIHRETPIIPFIALFLVKNSSLMFWKSRLEREILSALMNPLPRKHSKWILVLMQLILKFSCQPLPRRNARWNVLMRRFTHFFRRLPWWFVWSHFITSCDKEKILNKKFRSRGGSQVQLFCIHGTRVECQQASRNKQCTKLHFKKIIRAHTDGKAN